MRDVMEAARRMREPEALGADVRLFVEKHNLLVCAVSGRDEGKKQARLLSMHY
jgi:hypothetical protein